MSKRKQFVVPATVPRNPFAGLACARKAGSHRKSNKALRKLDKQRDRNSKVEYPAFNRSIPVRVWAVLP